MKIWFSKKKICGLVMAVSWLLGCQTIVDMDKPTAPSWLMWKKEGYSVEQIVRDLNDCGTQVEQAKHLQQAPIKQKFDATSICMLKKSYTFVPRPEGYVNWCHPQMFPDSIACKAYRGEYRVEVEATDISK